jgi:membrane protein YqaA with SNARE-associated domain
MLIYYKYMYSIFLAVGPLFLLIVLNSCIIVTSMVLKKGEGSSEDNIALVFYSFLSNEFGNIVLWVIADTCRPSLHCV